MYDRPMRKDLSLLMTNDHAAMERELYSHYRQHSREVIPVDVQDAIREQCGDRMVAGAVNRLFLPPTCDLHYPEPRIVAAAAALRAHPELVDQLNWHLATIATYRQNIGMVNTVARDLLARLGKG